ncbi:MAG TPA: sigma-70 family RNA polymerase sigma factor, partial [Syntrophomonadaceae bacterium]|nr:sigma-70 family RNA polymerase sigma factor [Syntrophomonadaceae bacterium]
MSHYNYNCPGMGFNGKASVTRRERDEIVRLHFEEGRSTRGLASEFGISRSAILNWIRAARSKLAEKSPSPRKGTGYHSTFVEYRRTGTAWCL